MLSCHIFWSSQRISYFQPFKGNVNFINFRNIKSNHFKIGLRNCLIWYFFSQTFGTNINLYVSLEINITERCHLIIIVKLVKERSESSRKIEGDCKSDLFPFFNRKSQVFYPFNLRSLLPPNRLRSHTRPPCPRPSRGPRCCQRWCWCCQRFHISFFLNSWKLQEQVLSFELDKKGVFQEHVFLPKELFIIDVTLVSLVSFTFLCHKIFWMPLINGFLIERISLS